MQQSTINHHTFNAAANVLNTNLKLSYFNLVSTNFTCEHTRTLHDFVKCPRNVFNVKCHYNHFTLNSNNNKPTFCSAVTSDWAWSIKAKLYRLLKAKSRKPKPKPTVTHSVCASLCTTVVPNTAQNSSDNLPSCSSDIHHCLDILPWQLRSDHCLRKQLVIKIGNNDEQQITSQRKNARPTCTRM